MRALWQAFTGGKERLGFRLIHFGVQRNHLHLIAEVDDREALLWGMRGLLVRIARQLNRALGRKGQVIADRYHVKLLKSLAQIRRTLCYVINQERRHCYQHGGWIKPPGYIDPCSSGYYL